MKKVAILLLITLLLLSGCASHGSATNSKATPDGATMDEATANQATPDTPAPTEPDMILQATQAYERILNSELTESAHEVDIEPIDQFPELPAGCEAVSLTMVINSYGYDLEKTDIVDNWLEYGSSVVDSYVGDPHIFLNGAGIYPPGLVNTVWNYVEDTNAKLYPIDTTEVEFDDLLKFVQADCPVVLWSTYYDAYPIPEGGAEERDGIVYQWYRNEHCVVLGGYDLDDNTVTLADPVRGIVTVSKSTIESIYDEMGQFSMIVLDTTGFDFPSYWELPRYTYRSGNDEGEDDE